jgi:hypothetical protein
MFREVVFCDNYRDEIISKRYQKWRASLLQPAA